MTPYTIHIDEEFFEEQPPKQVAFETPEGEEIRYNLQEGEE